MKNAFFIGNALLWLQLFEIFSQYLKLTVAAQASLTNIKCTSFNKTFVSFAECRLNLVKRGFNEYSIRLKVHQPPIENVTVRMSDNYEILLVNKSVFSHSLTQVHMQFMKKSNGYHPYMVDTIFDACKFMNTKSNPLLKYLYGFLRPYTNVNHSCPYDVSKRKLVIYYLWNVIFIFSTIYKHIYMYMFTYDALYSMIWLWKTYASIKGFWMLLPFYQRAIMRFSPIGWWTIKRWHGWKYIWDIRNISRHFVL